MRISRISLGALGAALLGLIIWGCGGGQPKPHALPESVALPPASGTAGGELLPPATGGPALILPTPASAEEYAEQPAAANLIAGEAELIRREQLDIVAHYARQLTARPGFGPDGRPTAEGIDQARRLRAEAARRLGATGDARVAPLLVIQLRQDEDRNVRLDCAAALGQLQAVAAVPALIPLLGDRDLDLAQTAMAALNRIMDAPALQDDPAVDYAFVAGKDLPARQGTAAKWQHWWDWLRVSHPELAGGGTE